MTSTPTTDRATHLVGWEVPGPWVQDAACRDEDPDLFFPSGYRGVSAAQVQAAVAVCARCTVRDACLAYVVANEPAGAILGVWGGLTPAKREQRRDRPRRTGRARLPIEHGTRSGYQAHRRRGEVSCGPCLEAAAVYRRAQRRRSAS